MKKSFTYAALGIENGTFLEENSSNSFLMFVVFCIELVLASPGSAYIPGVAFELLVCFFQMV